MKLALRTFTAQAKYGNRKAKVDGCEFDSQAEARRWSQLRALERAGAIADLERQVAFELVPAIPRQGSVPAQRAVRYVADFVYVEAGQTVVEDVKGMRTDVYRLKAKLLRWRLGIVVRETTA